MPVGETCRSSMYGHGQHAAGTSVRLRSSSQHRQQATVELWCVMPGACCWAVHATRSLLMQTVLDSAAAVC